VIYMVKDQKKLQNYLVLNRYLISLFNLKDIIDFRRIFDTIEEGISPNNMFYFTERLMMIPNLPDDFKQQLILYDERIQSYMNHINNQREKPIILKYYQYIAILLTEIYLDKYFNDFDTFYDNYISFIKELNKKNGSICLSFSGFKKRYT